MTICVRISKPAKTAMQSGKAKSRHWWLEALPEHRKCPEPIMGWRSAKDTFGQIRLAFPTAEEAVAYAEKQGWRYTLIQAHERSVKPKSYASNFID